MDQLKRKRSENWTTEEKDILRELISESRDIIDNKNTDTSSNNKKAEEWKNIAQKFNLLMGKYRSDGEVKLAWKRMKLAAKANLSALRQQQMQSGGGKKPKSSSREDLAIMDTALHDFITESNDCDSDAIQSTINANKRYTIQTQYKKQGSNHPKKYHHNKKVAIQESVLQTNIQLKRKQIEILEVEHKVNIQIAKLKMKKLQLEIELLEKRKYS